MKSEASFLRLEHRHSLPYQENCASQVMRENRLRWQHGLSPVHARLIAGLAYGERAR